MQYTWQLALVLVPVYFIKHSVSCYIYYMYKHSVSFIDLYRSSPGNSIHAAVSDSHHNSVASQRSPAQTGGDPSSHLLVSSFH